MICIYTAHIVKHRQTDFALRRADQCYLFISICKLAYANKTKESITSQKLGFRHFLGIANSVLNKGISAIPPLFNGPEVLNSLSDKAKFFAENFSKNSNLDGSHIFLRFPYYNKFETA